MHARKHSPRSRSPARSTLTVSISLSLPSAARPPAVGHTLRPRPDCLCGAVPRAAREPCPLARQHRRLSRVAWSLAHTHSGRVGFVTTSSLSLSLHPSSNSRSSSPRRRDLQTSAANIFTCTSKRLLPPTIPSQTTHTFLLVHTLQPCPHTTPIHHALRITPIHGALPPHTYTAPSHHAPQTTPIHCALTPPTPMPHTHDTHRDRQQ